MVERLTSRDQGHLNRDYFTLHLDTSGEGRYGFFFQLNLGDSISDGTILPERQFSRDWDGAWYGASSRNDDGWIAELHIPWSLLTMPKSNGERVIGIYTGRKVAYRDESYSWPGLPYTKPQFLSAFQPVLMDGVDPRQGGGRVRAVGGQPAIRAVWESFPRIGGNRVQFTNEHLGARDGQVSPRGTVAHPS